MNKNKVKCAINANVVFFINLCNFSGLKVYNVSQKDGKSYFYIEYRYLKKIKKIASDYNKELVIIEDKSINGFFVSNAKRIGVYVGIIIAILIIFVWSTSITEVKVMGNEIITYSKVMEILNEKISLPMKKNSVDVDEIERILLSTKEISSANVYVEGTVLFINILEELEEPKIVDYNEKGDIISKYDAIIVSIITYAGTPMVKAEDVVKKGDILISHETILEDGTILENKALGDIYGRVWISKDYVFTDKILTKERTGKNITYYLTNKSAIDVESPFLQYEREEKEFFNPNAFPLKLKEITFFEIEEKYENFNFEDKKEDIILEKTKELEGSLPKGSKKNKTWFFVKTVDKNTILVIYYEVIVKLNN